MNSENADTARGYTPQELVQAIRRRLRLALSVAGGVLAAAAVAIMLTPDEYRAEATLILEPFRPHAELVTPAVTTLLEDRLRVARQELLASPHLAAVVSRLGLFPDLVKAKGVEAAVDRLRRRLEVRPEGDSAIVVAYRTDRRADAAAVVAAVAEGYVRANSELRVGQARRVFERLGSQLENVAQQLEVEERSVRAFRVQHDGELPEQVEGNLREAERATHRLEAAELWRRTLEDRLASAPRRATSAEVERLRVVESDLLRQLNHARALFGESHPEPVRLARELEGARTLAEAAQGRVEATGSDRAGLVRELRDTKAEATKLAREATAARDRAAAGARWATELSVLERRRDLLREKYRSLLSRHVEAELALGLEEQAAPLATHVVSPPAAPSGPVAPDRAHLLLVALLVALALGGAAGVWAESQDESLRSPGDVRTRLGLPLLAVVPELARGTTPGPWRRG
jgi:succinoglycan biosynthesis transport protein ExoP